MKSRIKKRAIGIIAISLILVICLTLALYSAAFLSPATYSADEGTYKTIISGNSQGVDVYVTGDGVTWNEQESCYAIPQNATVEVTVVNNLTVSNSLEITGGTVEDDEKTANYAKVTNVTGDLNIEIGTSGIATARGTSLSTAYTISDSEDLLALSKILAAKTDGSDITDKASAETFAGYLAEFGLDNSGWYNDSGNFIADYTDVAPAVSDNQKILSTAYFRLTDEIMLNASTTQGVNYEQGYFGLGSRRGVPFGGVFDFNGHAVTMNVVVAETNEDNFSAGVNDAGQHILSIGFFNFIRGDKNNACAILDADVRGTISVSTSLDSNVSADSDYRLYVGGVAGTIGDSVVLDGVSSHASITVTADGGNIDGAGVSVYAGGVFGFSAADIDSWSDVSYIGNYSEISVTNKSNSNSKDTIVGALAGVIQNSYVNSFTATLVGANILADSTNKGSALAGGLAGAAYSTNKVQNAENLSDRNMSTISGININASASTISALIAARGGTSIDENNITSSDYDTAISGGVLGIVYAAHTDQGTGVNNTINITNITISAAQGASGALNVRSALSDGSSIGVPFAGGIFGYVNSASNSSQINYLANTSSSGDGKTIFNCDVSVTSTQTGTGPAYAGGIFGYNAFELPASSANAEGNGITFNLNGENNKITVIAEQTESAGAENHSQQYNVAAGFYTSVLPTGYSINNFTFNVNGGTIQARRLTGSYAVGDISAGAIAGKAEGNGSAAISNLKVNLNSCSVNALGYSFQSYEDKNEGNNVYAGGVIGYIAQYGSGSNYGLSEIQLNFGGTSDYAVRGIQNAQSGNDNYHGEGYVGGMFGMMHGSAATGLAVKSDVRDRALVYFGGTHNPNTSCVGGLIGATRVYEYTSYRVVDSSVFSIHVAGRSYTDSQPTEGSAFDLFVGGAIGVVGSAVNGGTHYIENISVENAAVESVGEEEMLTYAGGVIGGAWWVHAINISNLYSKGNSVLASSASYNTYAGGAIGQMEGSGTITFEKAIVVNTTVEALTYSSSHNAYAAGVCGRSMGNTTVNDSTSNAIVSASNNNSAGIIAGISIKQDSNGSYGNGNYFVAANVKAETLSEACAIRNEQGDILKEGSSYAIALKGSGSHNPEPDYAVNYATINSIGDSTSVYDNIGYNLNAISISSDGKTVTGITDSAGNEVTVRLVGGDYAKLERIYNTLYVKGIAAGTVNVQLFINGDMLCSYPIIIQQYSVSGAVGIYDAQNPDVNVSAENANKFLSKTQGSANHVDFSELNAQNINNSVLNITGTIYSVIGTNDENDREVSIRDENDNHNYLYFGNKISINQDTLTGPITEPVIDAVKFTVGGSGTLTLTSPINNDNEFNNGNDLLFNVYKSSDFSNYYISDVKGIGGGKYYTYTFTINEGGTYYVGSSKGGYRVYSIDYQYNDPSQDPNVGALVMGGYTYFQIYVGQQEKVQDVLVKSDQVYSPEIFMLSTNLIGYTGEVTDAAVNDMINAVGATSLTPSDVLDYYYLTLSDDGNQVSISPVLGRDSGRILLLRYNTGSGIYYVIIEVVPNAIEWINVKPAEDTPARAIDEDNGFYVYAPGDTVRLEAEIEYLFDFNRYIVDVKYEGKLTEGTGAVFVQPNGTIAIGSDVSTNAVITVTCKEINGSKTAPITLVVRGAITVTPGDMSGAAYTPKGNNNAVAGHEFTFYLDPNPGYGLNPTVKFDLYTKNNTLLAELETVFPEERSDFSTDAGTGDAAKDVYFIVISPDAYKGKYISVADNVLKYIDIDNIQDALKVKYSYDAASGRYEITIPEEVFKISGLSEITISASFNRVYSIMFDLGEWAQGSETEIGAVGTRYYTYQVKAGTKMNKALRETIYNNLNEAFKAVFDRKGFTFMGFYTTNYTSSLSGYGTSFYDTCEVESDENAETVHGAINYYARWNYTVVLKAPEGISIESALSSNLIDPNASNNQNQTNKLIPIDTEHGFNFRITGEYVGTPRVEVYSVAEDGDEYSLKKLDFSESNGIYTITDPDSVTGTIYVYVYGDNISVAVGEEDTDGLFNASIDLRRDGIFTVRYAINYGSAQKGLGNGAAFIFSEALPEKTAIRLFYQADGNPVSVSEYIVNSQSVAEVPISQFKDALIGSDTTPQYSEDSGTVYSEVYYLVITLPNNQNNLTGSDLTVSVSTLVSTLNGKTPLVSLNSSEYFTTGALTIEGNNQYKVQEDVTNAVTVAPDNISADVNLYNATIRSGSYSAGTLKFNAETKAETDSNKINPPTDVRHNNKYYVWRVEGTDVKVVGNTVITITTDKYLYIVIGDSAVSNKDVTITGTPFEIVLMEVTNPQYPAAGTIIYSVDSAQSSGN